MRDRVFVSLLFSLFLAIGAASAEAAPTPEAAFERYESALARAGLDAGAQGVYVETIAGKRLVAHNAEGLYNPASVVKLATSDVALRALGPDFRYETRLFAEGEVDRASHELRGNLVVVGSGDPSLTTEHAFEIADALRASGVERVTGDLVVVGPLSLDFSDDRQSAGETLERALDHGRWSPAVRQAWRRSRPGADPATFLGVEISGSAVVRPSAPVAALTPLFTHRSAPLIDILKTLNNYSNNWMAHSVGSRVGGAGGVERSIEDRYGFAPENVRLQTTSGLGENAMRPRDVVALLRGMAGSLEVQAHEPSHLMPVAGVDEGTLDTRLGESGVRGSVVAKTGTLSSVSVLAGFMYTRSEGVVLFAIMNRGGSPGAFRPLQDLLVRELFEACGGPAPIAYARRGWRDALGGSIAPPEGEQIAERPSRRFSQRLTAPGLGAPWRENILPFLNAGTRWPAWIDESPLTRTVDAPPSGPLA